MVEQMELLGRLEVEDFGTLQRRNHDTLNSYCRIAGVPIAGSQVEKAARIIAWAKGMTNLEDE